MRLPCSPQNPSGSLTDRSYICAYLVSSAQAFLAHSGETGNSVVLLIASVSLVDRPGISRMLAPDAPILAKPRAQDKGRSGGDFLRQDRGLAAGRWSQRSIASRMTNHSSA